MCIEFLINLYGKWQESDKFKENAFIMYHKVMFLKCAVLLRAFNETWKKRYIKFIIVVKIHHMC